MYWIGTVLANLDSEISFDQNPCTCFYHLLCVTVTGAETIAEKNLGNKVS